MDNKFRTGKNTFLANNDLATPVFFGDNCKVRNSRVGRYFGCGDFVRMNYSSIGSFCSFGDNVIVNIANHSLEFLTTSLVKFAKSDWDFDLTTCAAYEEIKKETEEFQWRQTVDIEHDVWIGSNVSILTGVTIGTGAVIGINSFVNRDVEPYEVVAGSPIKNLSFRFDEKIRKELIASEWWKLPINELFKLKIKDTKKSLEMLQKYKR